MDYREPDALERLMNQATPDRIETHVFIYLQRLCSYYEAGFTLDYHSQDKFRELTVHMLEIDEDFHEKRCMLDGDLVNRIEAWVEEGYRLNRLKYDKKR